MPRPNFLASLASLFDELCFRKGFRGSRIIAIVM